MEFNVDCFLSLLRWLFLHFAFLFLYFVSSHREEQFLFVSIFVVAELRSGWTFGSAKNRLACVSGSVERIEYQF